MALKIGYDFAGDAYPGEQQAETQANTQSDTTFDIKPETSEYKFFWGNGDLHVSPVHDHAELASHAGADSTHTGPMAVGFVTVDLGKATWGVRSNVNATALARVLKDYTKQVGWKWGGMTTADGEPIGAGSEFAPVKSYAYRYDRDHLYVAQTAHRLGRAHGVIVVRGNDTYVSGVTNENAEALAEWAEDFGLNLRIAANDNVLRTIEDLDQFNLGDPNGGQQEDRQYFPTEDDVRKPGGVYKCPNCAQIYPTWDSYMVHRRDEDSQIGEPIEQGGFPELNMDATFPPHFTEQQPNIHPVASVNEARRVEGFDTYAKVWKIDSPNHRHYVAYLEGVPIGFAAIREGHWVDMVKVTLPGRKIGKAIMQRVQKHYDVLYTNCATPMGEKLCKQTGWAQLEPHLWKWAAGTEPKDLIPAEIPFIYDIEQDQIHVGQPGTRTSDIPGKFTPSGIIEGTYEPGGKVMVKTMTNTPYTVRHMLELWYASQPHMEVKSVSLVDATGKSTKLASAPDIGSYIKLMVAADPTATEVYQTLTQAGGKVFVVGGAVRDAMSGKVPHDIDMMVTGLPAKAVRAALESLDGSVNLTGKDFGVFRYRRYGGEDIEIALPRREKSSGGGHKDFDVQADHTMAPEEDLLRRDFTANAMAVDLDTGHVLDPYGGSEDIKNGVLRTVSPNSLAEDPLRVVRALTAHAKHGLNPDDDTLNQMSANAGSLTLLPQDRIRKEIDKIMESPNPERAIRLAAKTGVLDYMLPDVARAMGHDQNNPHHEQELGEHLISVMRRAKERKPNDPDFVLAALLHDIGKVDSHWSECRDCGWEGNGNVKLCPACGSENTSGHFYKKAPGLGMDHETRGAEQAHTLLSNLDYPNDRRDRMTHLIQHHMWPAFASEKGARKFIHRVGDQHADDLLAMRWADQGGKSVYPTDPSLNIDMQKGLVESARVQKAPTNQSMLAINGNDLIAAGIQPGPQMGVILKKLLDDVIEDPTLNTKPDLVQRALSYS